jgi:hypothetical protein
MYFPILESLAMSARYVAVLSMPVRESSWTFILDTGNDAQNRPISNLMSVRLSLSSGLRSMFCLDFV